jgi:hypothetical protein
VALAVSNVKRNGHKFFTKGYEMKKSLIALALFASFGAMAQDSSSTSGSQSGSSSNSGAAAIGNQNAAQSGAQSGSRADSGSVSGAIGNAVILNVPPQITLSGPNAGVQSLGADGIATNRVQSQVSGGTTNTLAGGTNSTNTNTDNIRYSGTIENRATGGYNNSSLDVINQNVHYSGTQKILSAPPISMSGPASGPCTGTSGGIGVSAPGFGVGLNGAKVDDGCTVRENTRILGQLYQSLDAANPAKAEAQAALIEGMTIIRNMNAKIGGDYAQPAPPPKTAQAPAPVQQTAAVGESSDPYIRARMAANSQ